MLHSNLKAFTKYSPLFAFSFLPFASTAEVSFLLVFESAQTVSRAKGAFKCWFFIYILVVFLH